MVEEDNEIEGEAENLLGKSDEMPVKVSVRLGWRRGFFFLSHST